VSDPMRTGDSGPGLILTVWGEDADEDSLPDSTTFSVQSEHPPLGASGLPPGATVVIQDDAGRQLWADNGTVELMEVVAGAEVRFRVSARTADGVEIVGPASVPWCVPGEWLGP